MQISCAVLWDLRVCPLQLVFPSHFITQACACGCCSRQYVTLDTYVLGNVFLDTLPGRVVHRLIVGNARWGLGR